MTFIEFSSIAPVMMHHSKHPPRRIRVRAVPTILCSVVGTPQRAPWRAIDTMHGQFTVSDGAHRRGFTVIELIVAMTILMILTAAAVPIVRITIQRNKERDLRHSLWEMRDGIDRYKDAADRGAFQVKVDSQGYPPDLETLVKGVDSNGKKMRFLRRIPVDPMTGKTEWGLRSMQDDPDSDSWGGQNIFDVYTKSEGTALDGSKYKTW
jgi:general secretion pathway protein G